MATVESALKDCFIDGAESLAKALADHGVTVTVEEKDPVKRFQTVASLVAKHSDLFVCIQCYAFFPREEST